MKIPKNLPKIIPPLESCERTFRLSPNQNRNSTSMSEIIKNFLFLGSAKDAMNLQTLHAFHITFVLCVAHELRDIIQSDQSVKRLYLPLHDNAEDDISLQFQSSFDFINDAKMNKASVLVHCSFGISRAPAVIMAYLITVRSQSYSKAFRFVKSIRKISDPRLTFRMALQDLSNEIHGPDLDAKEDMLQSPLQQALPLPLLRSEGELTVARKAKDNLEKQIENSESGSINPEVLQALKEMIVVDNVNNTSSSSSPTKKSLKF